MKIFNFNLTPVQLFIDETGLVYYPFFAKIKSIRWKSVKRIYIETNNKGPFFEDFSYVIENHKNKIKIPIEEAEVCSLLSYLQKFDGFDSDKVIEASQCLENKIFMCWEKS
jgi:hypothetical protein